MQDSMTEYSPQDSPLIRLIKKAQKNPAPPLTKQEWFYWVEKVYKYERLREYANKIDLGKGYIGDFVID